MILHKVSLSIIDHRIESFSTDMSLSIIDHRIVSFSTDNLWAGSTKFDGDTVHQTHG